VTRRSVAGVATYLLEPKNWIIVTVMCVGWRYGGPAGAGWGAVAAMFAAVLPTMFITRGVRQGRWTDRNVGARGPRLVVLAFILASVFAGLCVLALGGAPRELTWYFGCMLGSVALLALITTRWKISIHCAVASGAVTILALIYGAWVLFGYLLVAVTAWSRVELGDHTRTQVVAGAVLGAAAAVASYALIRLPLVAAGTSTYSAYSAHRRVVSSALAVARSLPFGANATEFTAFACPLRVPATRPVAMSQSRTVPS
jgi:membrane-associated phospholipid phosphatase